jgi:hypothetical protein
MSIACIVFSLWCAAAAAGAHGGLPAADEPGGPVDNDCAEPERGGHGRQWGSCPEAGPGPPGGARLQPAGPAQSRGRAAATCSLRLAAAADAMQQRGLLPRLSLHPVPKCPLAEAFNSHNARRSYSCGDNSAVTSLMLRLVALMSAPFSRWAQVRVAAYELLAALRSLHQSLMVAGGGMPATPLAPSQSPGGLSLHAWRPSRADYTGISFAQLIAAHVVAWHLARNIPLHGGRRGCSP